MIRFISVLLAALMAAHLAPAPAAPSVYPTGTTIFDSTRAWNGFTVLTLLSTQAVVVIDMNGNVVKRWEDFNNSAGGPARILPGGVVVGARGARPRHQESLGLVQRSFSGETLWQLSENVQITLPDGEVVHSLRQHHDWQRADLPGGYYSPAANIDPAGSNVLVLTHASRMDENVADVLLEDDRIIEVNAAGELLWEWTAGEHIDEFDFDAAARQSIEAAPGFSEARSSLDWFHINSATYVGPNRWYDAGDTRFAPDNVIISSRQASIVAIVARDGSVVWQIGPDFGRTAELRAIRQIIGQHHAHLIPPGLPGAGNMLVFDNGGSSGYGAPSAIAPNGLGIYARSSSRVLEIDPVSLELVWVYQAPNFFSTNISGAQRLPNGNTLITEGA
ncbi:MAG TPA: aryl-sulfate sulfotransferase, partial [Gammaproteobacteria bacterium]|nr:aryl-sulfate sulfotransferase [Gammaproteobacteria bacterium]